MITTDLDLDLEQLPSDTLVTENGRITPIGELVIAKLAKDLADTCSEADDPQAALQVILEILPKQVAEIASQCTTVNPSPLRRALTGLVGSQCMERRPGRDPLTGDRLDGQRDDHDTWPDRLLCTQRHGHNGDHRDGLSRSWQRGEVAA
ncbi:hypothetical protein [Streptomyces sp. NBC_01477]|uniref:hypothetical protein n=1 Tax=Streptomyces sp. NBC_01477 TaxID=2976015 RepID=UPI002E37C8FA|nr:hypothetical protein [Streptomyces sp. NBC_01477]